MFTLKHGSAGCDRKLQVKGFYRNTTNEMELPKQFIKLLEKQQDKRFTKNDISLVSFTYGTKDGYAAIAITDMRDTFSRKIGIKIVTGRLNHAINGLYKELPPTVIKLT